MTDYSSLAELVRRILSQEPASRLRIGVSGHRFLGENVRGSIASEFDALFAMLAEDPSARERFAAVSSLAVGTDQFFAGSARRHGIPTEVVLPFAKFVDDFAEGTEREGYESLLSSATVTRYLPWQDRSNGAYLAGGLWIVDHCDVFLAVWNGKKAAGIGGTGDVVEYCRDIGKPCIHLHSESLKLREL